MIDVTLKSKITGRIINESFTARQLLDTDEESLIERMSRCDCQAIEETNVIDCGCDEEWYEYSLIIGSE